MVMHLPHHDANHLGQVERIRGILKKSRVPSAESRVPARQRGWA